MIGSSLTITGPGALALTISANNTGRVFHITGGAVAISGLKMTNGTAGSPGSPANGGDILVDNTASLTLTNAVVSGGTASSGGGIFSAGFLTLNSTTVTGNMATGDRAGGLLGGGGLDSMTGAVTLNSCQITNNQAPNGLGGGLLAASGPVTVRFNSPNVTNSTLSNNGAVLGGGVYCASSLVLTQSAVIGNTASGDAGTGQGGGGIFVKGNSSAGLTNDTLSNNTASNGDGGGADNQGTLFLTSCTVSGNIVYNGNGGGLRSIAPPPPGGSPQPPTNTQTTLQATIVAGNVNYSLTSQDASGAFTSAGSNLIGDGTGAGGFTGLHDQVGTPNAPIDPLLGPLQNNGGSTLTQALGAGSPAINADYSANSPANDQRGIARPIGPRADIGAYEAPSPPLAPTNLQAVPGFARVTLSWTGTPDAVSYNVYRGTTPGGEDLANPINTDPTTLQVKPILGTRYIDLGLTNGVTYYYVVVGVNAAGQSAPSNEAFATPADTRVHGSVLTWGDNQYGQLGNGTVTRSLLAGPIVPAAGQALNNIVQVAGGGRYSLALTSNGSVYAWGDDTYGQLGDGKQTFSSQVNENSIPGVVQTQSGPLTNVVAIAAGQDHALALTADGSVYSWGRNQYGQLGNGSTDSSAYYSYYGYVSDNPYATLVRGGSHFSYASLSGVTAIAAGGYHSLAVLSDGTVVAWGYNSSGQLGDAASGSGADSAYPVPVSSLTNAVSVAAGQYFSLALTASGSVYGWGYDNDGELGIGSFGVNQTVPVLVQLNDATTNLPLVATQIAAGDSFALALVSAGSVYAWGSDALDQLGDNSAGSGAGSASGFGTSSPFSPLPIPVGMISALSVGAGSSSSLAVQPDHTLLTWGANSSGQLGTGAVTASQQPAPAQTSFGSPLPHIYSAAGGRLHSLAIQNLPPTVARVTYIVGVNTTRDVPAPGLIASAADAENDGPLIISLVRPTTRGTVTVYPSGRFTYVPQTGFQGTDSFTYKANDGLADSAPATVTLTVVPETLQSIARDAAGRDADRGRDPAVHCHRHLQRRQHK